MDEYYVCHTCSKRQHISTLKKLDTMPGDYCRACSEEEKCAACGELYQHIHLHFKHDIKNYVCTDCVHCYHESTGLHKTTYFHSRTRTESSIAYKLIPPLKPPL